MWTRVRVVALGAAALTLAACGSIHPGDAAVVDGQAISMKTFDKNARLLCDVSLRQAKAQGQDSLPNDQVRRQAIVNLVSVVVARDIAKQKGITPDKATYELPASQVERIAKAFPNAEDAATVVSIYEDFNETIEIATQLGEQSSGVSRTDENQQQLAAEGQDEIQKAFKDHDVKFAPLFGLSGTLKDLGPTGSLSVPDPTLDTSTDTVLPPAQRCA